jgi:hypothetical protein
MRTINPRVRIALLSIVSIAAVLAVALHAPIPQPSGYHNFADQRQIGGVANFWNVISNLPFLIVGLAGLRELATRQPSGVIASLRPAYFCLFAGIVLVGFGSGYYHFAPSDAALTWDRLPMTIALMALFAIVIGEHIQPRAGLRLLVPLMLLGAGSVWYWHVSRQAGHGDLRPYLIVQFLPLLLVPLILLLFPSRLTGVWFLWALLGAYVIAKLLEKADDAVFNYGQLVSGHTLKHLAAGFGMYLFFLAIRHRRPVAMASDHARPAPQLAGAKAR